MSKYDATKAANIAVDKLLALPEGTSHYILTEALNIIADNISGGSGIPSPDPGILADNEMIKANAGGTALVGTGDTNTTLEVDFGSKDIKTTGVINSGSGTFQLGGAHAMSSGGENVIFTNLVDGDHFNPAWVNQETNLATVRVTTGTFQELTQEPSKADVLINPSWTSNPVVDWRVLALTVEAETTITNAVFNVTRNGNDFYRAKMGTLTANVETIVNLDASVDNVPVDAFQSGVYVVSVTSVDGDVRLKGSTANLIPFFKVGYFEFSDKLLLTEDDFVQKQLIRSGVKGNYGVTSITGNTQVQVTADDLSGFTELYFNVDVNPDSNSGVVFQMPDTATTVPNDPDSKDYFLSIDNTGTFAITTAKVSAGDLTKIALCTFMAQNGIIEPTTLSNEPYLTWVDHTFAGVLEKKGAELVDLTISSQNNSTMGISHSAYVAIADGINYDVNKVDPHAFGVAADPTMNWTYAIRNFNTPPAIGAAVLLDSNQWDNSGVLTAVPAAQATVQAVYWVRKSQFVIIRGQQLFSNYDDALLNYLNISFILPAQSKNWEEVARIVLKQGGTDSNDISEVLILDTTKGAGGGGIDVGGDVNKPASAIANEIATYLNVTGDTLLANSNITAIAGVIKRILANNHIAIDNKLSVNTAVAPRGIIQANVKAGDTDSYGGDINCPLVGNITLDNGGNTPAAKAPALTLLRNGVSAQAFGNVFEIGLSRYENSGNNARTRADFLMAHGAGSVEGNNIPLFMSMYSSGQLDTPTTASWTIGGTRDVTNYKFSVKGLGAIGFPEVTTAQKVALTGLRNNAVVYDTTLGRLERHVGSNVWENLSDITKPATTTVNEVPTYTNVTGSELGTASDVTINEGVIGRITGGQHIAIEDKLAVNTNNSPRGVIQANAKPNATSSYTSDVDCPIVANLVTNNGGNTPATALPAFVMVRPGVTNDSFGNIVEAMLSRYENVSFNARTKLEWRMAHGDGNTEDNNIPSFMSWYSSGQLDTPANSHWTIGGGRDTGEYALSLKGLGAFGVPEMTTVQKTALTGLRTNAIVYDTTLSRFEKHLGVGVWGPLVPTSSAFTINFKFDGALAEGTSILTANRNTPYRYFGQRLQIVRVEVYSRIGSDNTALLTMKSGGVDITSVNLNARSGLFTNGALPGDRFIEDGDILELDYNELLSTVQGTDIEVYLEVQPI